MNSAKSVKKIRKGFPEWKEKIDRGGTIETCQQTLTEAVAWSASWIAWTKSRANAVMASWAANWQKWFGEAAPAVLQILHFETKAAHITEIGAWFTVALEAVIGGFMSVVLFSLDVYGAAAIGVAITLILALVAKGILPTFFHARWSNQPKAGVQQMAKFLLYLGALELLLLLTMFFVRGSVGGPIFEHLWWISTTLSAITTPILAAALFIQSSLLGWSEQLRDEHELLVALQFDLEAFRDFCLHRLADKTLKTTDSTPGAIAEPAPAAQEKGKGVHVAALMIGALSFSLCLLPLNAAALQVQVGLNCDGRPTLQMFFDDSTSASPKAREMAKILIRDELAANSGQLDVCKFELVAFFEDGFDAAPYFTSGFLPPLLTDAQCPTAQQGRHLNFLKRARDNDAQKAKEACAQLKNDAGTKIKDLMAPVYRALSDPLPAKSGRCTSLFDTLYRVGSSSKPIRAIIVSDGIESCHSAAKPLPAPKPNTQIVMVLISTRKSPVGTTRAEEFRARMESILKVAPWVKVTSLQDFSFDLFGGSQPTVPRIPERSAEKTALKVSTKVVADENRQ